MACDRRCRRYRYYYNNFFLFFFIERTRDSRHYYSIISNGYEIIIFFIYYYILFVIYFFKYIFVYYTGKTQNNTYIYMISLLCPTTMTIDTFSPTYTHAHILFPCWTNEFTFFGSVLFKTFCGRYTRSRYVIGPVFLLLLFFLYLYYYYKHIV